VRACRLLFGVIGMTTTVDEYVLWLHMAAMLDKMEEDNAQVMPL
jgi:hypothetical protein